MFARPVAWALINTDLYGGPMFTSHFCDPLLGRKEGDKKCFCSPLLSSFVEANLFFILCVCVCLNVCIYNIESRKGIRTGVLGSEPLLWPSH